MSISAEHDAARSREKSEAIAMIEHALSKIASEGREPDLWERTFLIQAIDWLFRGGYRIAAVDAALALTPQNQRAPEANLKPDPLLDRCDVATLRAAFEECAAQPLADFTTFGPIKFANQ